MEPPSLESYLVVIKRRLQECENTLKKRGQVAWELGLPASSTALLPFEFLMPVITILRFHFAQVRGVMKMAFFH